jgi:hypothetical protein
MKSSPPQVFSISAKAASTDARSPTSQEMIASALTDWARGTARRPNASPW